MKIWVRSSAFTFASARLWHERLRGCLESEKLKTYSSSRSQVLFFYSFFSLKKIELTCCHDDHCNVADKVKSLNCTSAVYWRSEVGLLGTDCPPVVTDWSGHTCVHTHLCQWGPDCSCFPSVS